MRRRAQVLCAPRRCQTRRMAEEAVAAKPVGGGDLNLLHRAVLAEALRLVQAVPVRQMALSGIRRLSPAP